MKTLILLIFVTFVVSSLALTDSQREKLTSISDACKPESGLIFTEEVKTKFAASEFDDPKMKKHFICMWKKLGLANEDGEIVEDKLHERVKAATQNEEKADKICKKCNVKKDTHVETIIELHKCLIRELPEFTPVE